MGPVAAELRDIQACFSENNGSNIKVTDIKWRRVQINDTIYLMFI